MLIGVDVTSIERVAAVVARTPRFATRIFTEHERERAAPKPERWATSWAAKEAVRKLYSSAGLPMPAYHDVEVVRRRGRPPQVAVAGALVPVALTLTHDAGVAIAVAAVDGAAAHALRPTSQLPDGFVLAPRPGDAHKGTFGHVYVVAGAAPYTGAPHLAAYGAARGGAGLVTVCVPQTIHHVVAARCIEVMPLALPDDAAGVLTPVALAVLRDAMAAADALVIGPGIGTAAKTQDAFLDIVRALPCPAVVDADGLNIAARTGLRWRDVPQPVVITPHPAEMARLRRCDTADVQRDREGTALAYAREHGVTVVLKGSGTVVASPDGAVHVDTHHVVALATGGTGDVLAGVTGAMLAQGLAPHDAAVAAVTVHAEAGERVQQRQGRAGALASDVLDALPEAQEALRNALERRARGASG
jgi:NAD(P)H-hydrate epimerase